ncbi:GntR family transcriptional regulator [Vogesella sp. LIG4]|uniref:GntR family transcriptional regulator n=1 Tax=Vogesella sp. LIG4 TaxID=1192162 RepID=UPI0008202275|nr:GntR family transcriptional regulator [Vogesella sp. LIG4]SCK05991.1 GntR family transcriptional regulator [Vogesella sp. LIG4]
MNAKSLLRLPLYEQIKQQILQRIADSEWASNELLPSEWDLAEQFAVSQGTVRKALTDLVNDGVLYRQQGRGTFVAEALDDWAGMSMVSPGLLSEKPDRLVREFLGISRAHANEELAAALGLRRGAGVHRIRLLWRVQGQAVALDEVTLPLERFETLDARWLRQSVGVWAVLQQHFGVRLRVAAEQWRAVGLTREEAQLLHAREGDAALFYLRVAEDIHGQALEWRERWCLTGSLALTSQPAQ